MSFYVHLCMAAEERKKLRNEMLGMCWQWAIGNSMMNMVNRLWNGMILSWERGDASRKEEWVGLGWIF